MVETWAQSIERRVWCQAVLGVLGRRFGSEATELAEEVEALKDRDALERLHKEAAVVESLEDFQQLLQSATC